MTTLNEAVSMFLLAKKCAKSKRTTTWYDDCLTQMVQYIGTDTDITKITAHKLRLWLDDLGNKTKVDGKKLSIWTLHGYARSARALFRWLVRDEILQISPFTHVELPQLPKTPRRGITDKNRDAMLKIAENNPRDYAILRLAAASGARRNGIATMTLINLNLEQRQALVCEKGDKSRYIFFDSVTATAISNWLTVRPELADDDNVFGLASEGVYRVFERIAGRAGIKSGWNPHNWRHAFARHYLKNGGDIGKLSQLLGHSDIKVTHEHYGGLDVDELHESYDEFAPEF